MTKLTPRQSEVLAFIWARIQKRQPPPTMREIGAKFGIGNHNGVVCHLKALKRKGWLELDFNSARGLRLTQAARKRLSGLPLVNLADLNRE